jgi:VanZ family protein
MQRDRLFGRSCCLKTIAKQSGRGHDIRMFHKLIAAAAWACLIFITYATLTSINARPELTGSGFYKAFFTVLERFGAYALLGLLFRLAYPRHVGFICLIVFGSAIILELLQIFVPDRDARVIDALEKSVGGAAGILVGRALLGWWR